MPNCPCDQLAEEAGDEEGARVGRWVVEVKVAGSPRLQPLFRNEEGLVYTRCLSSNIQVSQQPSSSSDCFSGLATRVSR